MKQETVDKLKDIVGIVSFWGWFRRSNLFVLIEMYYSCNEILKEK